VSSKLVDVAEFLERARSCVVGRRASFDEVVDSCLEVERELVVAAPAFAQIAGFDLQYLEVAPDQKR